MFLKKILSYVSFLVAIRTFVSEKYEIRYI